MKVGVNGAVRNISDLKVGVSGAVRAVSEAYIGVAGATKKVWPSLPAPGKALDNYTWDEISQISSANLGESYFSVGDRKQITLNGTIGLLTLSNYSTYAFIIGFNHNSGREGSGRIHFQFAKTALAGGTDICFVDGQYGVGPGSSPAFRMNMEESNAGGWAASYMRNHICGMNKDSTSGTFMGVIPADLRNALKSVTKYTDNTGNSSSSGAVTATTDYFFLLAEYEVYGTVESANTYEADYQQQYAYYSAGNSKEKYRHNSPEDYALWWLRSPCSYASYLFLSADGDYVSNLLANVSYGFSPCFCV